MSWRDVWAVETGGLENYTRPALVFGFSDIARVSRPVFGLKLCTSGATVQQALQRTVQQKCGFFRPLDRSRQRFVNGTLIAIANNAGRIHRLATACSLL